MIARRIVVRGRVQGVGYRSWALDTARALGLLGWVRNRGDGTVEFLAMGEPERISSLVEACRQGPPTAAVESVEVTEASIEAVDRFELRSTE